jgi:hypothetical protein
MGEITALRRCDIDLTKRTVRVRADDDALVFLGIKDAPSEIEVLPGSKPSTPQPRLPGPAITGSQSPQARRAQDDDGGPERTGASRRQMQLVTNVLLLDPHKRTLRAGSPPGVQLEQSILPLTW